jgi:DNA adenine methylase
MVKETIHNIKSPPLLKWPGGKRRLLKYLLPKIPDKFNQYYEPFLGAGALFFAVQPSKATIADNNPELINCYIQVRDNSEKLIALLATMKNTKEDYYAIRQSNPLDKLARAARLIYLVTLSFNGIHRVNLKGDFNVPYGSKTHLQPCDPQRIRSISAALSSVNILCSDFELTVQNAQRGDLVYFDPPYTVAHGNNGFIKYNSKIFSWDDQIRLAKVAKDLSGRGCRIIISNAHHPSIIDLYNGFQMRLVERPSVIAASANFRMSTTECIFFN